MIALSARRVAGMFLWLTVLAGCGSPAFREGRDLAADGNLEAALPKLKTAADADPTNAEYRAAYLRTRELLVNRWLEQAAAARRDGKAAEAEKVYRRLQEEDPGNARARDGLAELDRDLRHAAWLADAGAAFKKQDYEVAAVRLRLLLSENPEHPKALELKRRLDEKLGVGTAPPRLAAGLRKPLTIEFKDTPLRQIFEILSRTSGLNFVFDKELKGEQRATIFLRNTSVQDALDLLMLTNQLEYRVLNASSILIYPNAAAKLKDYQPLSVRTFLLSNVDAKTASNTLKTILKTKDLVVDEKQNLIVMRDTADAIRMAEKMLALQDRDEAEVMLDVAVLEVSRDRLIKLGVQWPGQLALAPIAGASGNVTLADLRHLHQDMVSATLSPLTVNANKTDSIVNLLANPRIRARNHETAKVMIGDRIPNITTTSTATGFVSENIQYVDVGLKLEVQPTVYADNEVAIKIALEASSIVKQIQTKSGSLAYQIGTRNASTLLKLKDGENQILAGLIRNEESSSGDRLPGLGDVPLLGRLFGSQSDTANKTEIVLSITPHLIRNAHRPEAGLIEFESGTESSLKLPSPPTSSGGGAAMPISASAGGATGPETTLPSVPVPQPTEAAPAGPTSINLQGPAQARAGSTFSVRVAIEPGEPVTSIPFALSFDPKVLEVVSVTEGDFLKQGGGTTSFTHRVDKGSGQIFATVTRTGKDGAGSPGSIVDISFRALAPAPAARLVVSAIAPIGVGGRAVSAPPPSPLVIAVAP